MQTEIVVRHLPRVEGAAPTKFITYKFGKDGNLVPQAIHLPVAVNSQNL